MEPRISCSTLTYSRERLPVAVERLAALGFHQLDLGIFEGWTDLQPSALVADRSAIDRTARLVAESGAEVVALNVGLGSDDADTARARLEAVLELAQQLAVPVVTLGAPESGTPIDVAAAFLSPLAELGAVSGVDVTVETHVGTVAEHPAHAAALLESVPALGLTLDPCHVVCGPAGGNDLELLFPLARHVHIRDALRAPAESQVAFGTGRVDFEAIVAGLDRNGYQGWLSIEYIDFKTDDDIDEQVLHAAASLAGVLAATRLPEAAE